MIMTQIAKAPPSVFKNERSEGATEIYIRGPGWPATATDDAPNPWSKRHWNLTQQGHIYKLDRDKAMRMAKAAGHRDVLSARLENAK
jgi:hypothetical protein